MDDLNRLKAINKALHTVAQGTTIPRKDEKLFGILLAGHMISNGFPEDIIDPDLIMLSIRDAYHEYTHIKETNANPTIESVFTEHYINVLKEKKWINESQFN